MSSKPNLTRMQTRASNSNAHPGRVIDTLRVHRPKEVVQKEKDEKMAKQAAQEEKRVAYQAHKQAGEKHISQLEAEVAAKDAEDKSRYPRHQTKRS